MLTFDKYEEEAGKTAIYPNRGDNVVYPTLGLVGEAGEVAEKVKKIIRDKNGVFSKEDKVLIAKEIGDCLWYISALAYELEISMHLIAQRNLDKLKDRQDRDKLCGSGDNR